MNISVIGSIRASPPALYGISIFFNSLAIKPYPVSKIVQAKFNECILFTCFDVDEIKLERRLENYPRV